jgi:signal transduction histidine kinase
MSEKANEAKPTRILLVEDEQDHVELIKRAFDRWRRPFYLHVANSLSEAENYLTHEKPDVAIIDWKLPDGKGRNLLSLTQAKQNFPVIIMTSFGNEDLAVEMLKTGAADYIVKSAYSLSSMPQSVGRVLREFEHIQLRENAESALREANSQLEKIVAERTEALVASNRSLEKFAYLVSHDLQEPLRMVTSYLQLIDRRAGPKLNPDEKEFLNQAVNGAKRMREMLDSILTYSRLQIQEPNEETIDLNEIVDSVLQHLAPLIRQKNGVVKVAPLPTIKGEYTMMIQLFQNLIGNGLKYSEESPMIQVACQDEGASYHFTVQDNGIGIEPRFQKQIFGMFQRLHTQEQYRGTGVGLSICKTVVERHGGEIWLESEKGRGTTFHFTLLAKS